MKKHIKLNTLTLILGIFTLFFCGANPRVEAIEGNQGGDTAGSGVCTGGEWCWPEGSIGLANPIQGIRVTVFNVDGTPYTKSVDLLNTSSAKIINSINTGSINGRAVLSTDGTAKISYTENGSYSPSWSHKTNDVRLWSFPNILGTSGAGGAAALKAQFLSFKTDRASARTFFQYFGIDIEQYTDDQLSRLYLTVEPLTAIFHATENVYYFGTSYELSWLPNVFVMTNVMGKNIPRALMLDERQDTDDDDRRRNFVGKPGNWSAKAMALTVSEQAMQLTSKDQIITKKGWGIGIYWLRDLFTPDDTPDDNPNCEETWVVYTTSSPAVCRLDNQNNKGTYTEKTKKVNSCNTTSTQIKTDTKYGRYIRNVPGSNYCRVYCLEKAETSFPGNIANALTIGTKLMWPTSSSSYGNWTKNIYPLTMYGEMNCKLAWPEDADPQGDYDKLKNERDALLAEASRLESKAAGCHTETREYECGCDDETGSCDTCTESYEVPYDGCFDDLARARRLRQEAAELLKKMQALQLDMYTCLTYEFNPEDREIYNFVYGASISYDDIYYGDSFTLDVEDTYYECNGCSWTGKQTPSTAMNALISAINNRKVSYIRQIEFKLPDNLYRYVNKKDLESAMTITKDQINDYYKVNYPNLPISWNAELSKKYHLYINNIQLGHNGRFTTDANKKTYKCEYEVTLADNGCKCPEGTKHAGEDLYCKIKNANDNGYNYTCTDGQVLWCDGSTNVDYDDDQCDSSYCPNDPTMDISSCVYGGMSYIECADLLCYGKNNRYECPSNTPNWHMDISNCVYTKVAQGFTLNQAISSCEKILCPADGVRIIYRTINLANPFPGKDIDQKIPGFNYDVLGRYPGNNWNSKTLVTKEILKNRGVNADKVYAKDVTPLYTITLDPKIIGKIRQYNKQQKKNDEGYADFTLECKNGVSCISKQFLRDVLGNYVTGGTCKNVTHGNFYNCSEVKS